MSEDEDERMDRATRIREMREGQRNAADADDDGQDAEDSSADAGGTESDDGAAADGAVPDEGAETDDVATDEDATPSTEPAAADDDTTDEPDVEAETAESADEPDAEERSDSADEPDAGERPDQDEELDEAAVAAQRAAQAAADVTGGAGADAAAAVDTAPTGETAQPSTADGPAGTTGVELPDQESIQAAIADEELGPDADSAARTASGRVIEAQNGASAEESVRVLEFSLGDEHYCLDIAHVEEIVKRESITRVPNTPEYVEGVVDLRGQITTILDPKQLLDIDEGGTESLLVVFEPGAFEDQGAIGWVVDEVRQVVPVTESMITEAPVDADYVEGVIDRGDESEFVIWTNPEVAIELATGERSES